MTGQILGSRVEGEDIIQVTVIEDLFDILSHRFEFTIVNNKPNLVECF
jgi:hypothetical protein